MAETNTNGEATPQNNTAQAPVKLNPIQFPEAALEELLNRQLSGAKEETNGTPEAKEAEEEPTETQSSEETAEADSDDSEDDAHSQSEEETSETEESEEQKPNGVQKRIDKLTARAKEAEERAEAAFKENEAIKQRLQELEQKSEVAPEPSASLDNRFNDVWDFNKLKHEKAIAYNLVEWCEDNRDGAEVNGTEYTAEQIRAIRKNAKRTLDIHIPERETFLAHYNQVKPQVEALYPFWKDTRSAEYVEAQQILKVLPQLKSHPEYQVWIGDALEGRKARLAKQSAKKVVATSKPAPKQPSQPKASPSRVDPKQDSIEKAKAKFFQTGSEEALVELLKGI